MFFAHPTGIRLPMDFFEWLGRHTVTTSTRILEIDVGSRIVIVNSVWCEKRNLESTLYDGPNGNTAEFSFVARFVIHIGW